MKKLKSIIITGSNVEELQDRLQFFLTTGLNNVQKEITSSFNRPVELINVQPYNKQLVTPNALAPNQPKIELVFQILIIYR